MNTEYIEPEDSTANLLKNIGIEIDKRRKSGRRYMLVKNGVDIGYFSADKAHETFLK